MTMHPIAHVLPLALVACAPPPKSPDPRDLAPLTVDYRVTSRAPDGALIVGGAIGVSAVHDAVFKQSTARGAVELKLEARRLGGDDLIVLVHYRESSADGVQIDWQPALVLRRNGEASATVDTVAGGRALTLALR